MGKLLLWIGVCLQLSYSICVLVATPTRERGVTIHRIRDDRGGNLMRYIEKYARWSVRGDRVIIEGSCQSACTMLLGLFDSERVCATNAAMFGFHSAALGDKYADDGTRLMWTLYRGRTAEVLAAHGWTSPSEHPAIIPISAREIVRPCTRAELKGGQ